MSHKAKVIVTFPDGSEVTYASISETAIAVGLRRLTVHRHLNGEFSRSFKGYKFRRESISDDDSTDAGETQRVASFMERG